MNWALSKIENLASKFDNLTYYNQLDNPQNIEVGEFMRNYHALAFELARYHRTTAQQNLEADLCQSIIARIDAMNDFLLSYQFAEGLTDTVSNLRSHYRMDDLLETRNAIYHRLTAQQQPYHPFVNTTDVHSVYVSLS